jgi:FkbM family methyltransferase
MVHRTNPKAIAVFTLANVLRMAESRLAAGDARGGLDIYRQILAREPENPDALLGALRAARMSGDPAAMGAAQRDLERTYGTQEAAVRFGTAKAKLEAALALLAEAGDAAEAALKSGPKSGEAFSTAYLAKHHLGELPEYFSQFGQDQFLAANVFANQRSGVFVDIGAYDGISGSNTLHFEKFMNWTGLCIEPDPRQFERLSRIRSCRCLQTCIGEKTGPAQFLRVEKGLTMMGGLVDHMDPADVQMVRERSTALVAEVGVRRLDEVLAESGIAAIDYLSIDTEGSELSILRSLNLSSLGVRALSVENNRNTPAIPEHMRAQGYLRAARLGVDDIYVKSSPPSRSA